MEVVLEVDPLTEFFSAIENDVTRDRYEKRLRIFFEYLKLEGSMKEQAKEFVKRATKAELGFRWATVAINQYMQSQRERAGKGEISESTVPNFYKPIKLFCEENDILLNWKKIARRIPKGRKYANDRAPTREEIIAILGYRDPRIKPIVLSMASGGFRVGAWDYLKVKHLDAIQKKEGTLVAGKLRIYPGTDEEYTAFITPEAYRALNAWLESRKEAGENVTKESWLMRDLWDDSKYRNMTIARRGLASVPRHLTSTGVRRLIERALVAQGVRKEKLKGKERRHEFQTDHGFRKFFDSVCDKYMKTLYVEFLLGHNTGLKESYNRAQEEELLSEYEKAIPYLTFLESILVPKEDLESLKNQVAMLSEELKADKAKRSEVEKYFENPEVVKALMKILSVPGVKKTLENVEVD